MAGEFVSSAILLQQNSVMNSFLENNPMEDLDKKYENAYPEHNGEAIMVREAEDIATPELPNDE